LAGISGKGLGYHPFGDKSIKQLTMIVWMA
jgi:hypothetical protein